MIGNEDGIIEEEMIELCGSADINDLIRYCRSLKKDVQHQIEIKTVLENALQTEQQLRFTVMNQTLDISTKLHKIRDYAQNGGMDCDDAWIVMDIINGEDEEE